MHDYESYPKNRRIKIKDKSLTKTVTLAVNENMVKLLLGEAEAPKTKIIVWSRAGARWATEVILALGLQDKVYAVMAKPTIYFDDKPCQEWLVDRVYMNPNVKYKQT